MDPQIQAHSWLSRCVATATVTAAVETTVAAEATAMTAAAAALVTAATVNDDAVIISLHCPNVRSNPLTAAYADGTAGAAATATTAAL